MARRMILAALLLALLIPSVATQAFDDQSLVDTLAFGTNDFVVHDGALTLAPGAPVAAAYLGNFVRSGSFLSSEHTFGQPVKTLRIFVDAEIPAGAAVRVDVRGKNSFGAWQLWSEATAGKLVALERPAATVQFRVTLLTNDATPVVRSVKLVPAEWAPAEVGALAEPVAPTYRIHATREGLVGFTTANGHVIRPRDHFVALPSWRSLSSRGGNEYRVRLTYKGRSVVVPVWDVGPWNTRDDYWSTNREMWRDLPRGLPEAQAANQWGYNGGRDQFGRKPNLPNGIDIADGTFWDSLGMVGWDWVDVTFLWEGRDPGPGNTAVIEPGPPPAPAPTPTPTPAPPPPPAPAAPEGALVVDNGTDGFSEPSGTWFNGTCGVGNSHRWTYSAKNEALSENVGLWQAPITKPGFYEVYALVPPCGTPATRNATYIVDHEGSETRVKLDQEANQNTWTSLGVYFFKPGTGNDVRLTDLTGEQGLSVRYDAMAWVPRADTAPPTATISNIRYLGAGKYEVVWSGEDAASGVASFDIQVQRDGGVWSDWMVATSNLSGTFLVADTAPAVYGFRVRARDWAGNTSAFPAQATLTTDQAAR